MTFTLDEEYIELFKLLKVMGVAESGAHAKTFIEEGHVKRNGEVETRKRAKIVSGKRIEVGGEEIEIRNILS